MPAQYGSSRVSGEALVSTPNATDAHERDHFVQFYDSDSYLTESVCDFIRAGLLCGEDAVVIATRAHRESLEIALEGKGIDLIAARVEGRYVALDAATTLSRFMVDAEIDFTLLDKTIREFVARPTNDGSVLHVYGEMVTLLWDEGNVSEAIRLEDFWNSLMETQSLALMCGYPMRSFNRGRGYRSIRRGVRQAFQSPPHRELRPTGRAQGSTPCSCQIAAENHCRRHRANGNEARADEVGGRARAAQGA